MLSKLFLTDGMFFARSLYGEKLIFNRLYQSEMQTPQTTMAYAETLNHVTDMLKTLIGCWDVVLGVLHL